MDIVKILHTDKHLTVCVKPPLSLSQSDEKNSPSMTDHLAAETNAFHKVIHRLDFGVGGTMVYAKSDFAAAFLSADIQNKVFQKEYLAVVFGKPSESSGVYKDLLFKDSSKNKSFVVDRMRKGVKEASLEYKVLETVETEKGELSLVWIKLHTGRTHQIRVQFSSRKTPLYGDGKYGSCTNEKITALWSFRLSFRHPASKKNVSFSSLPDGVFPWNAFNIPDLLEKNV